MTDKVAHDACLGKTQRTTGYEFNFDDLISIKRVGFSDFEERRKQKKARSFSLGGEETKEVGKNKRARHNSPVAGARKSPFGANADLIGFESPELKKKNNSPRNSGDLFGQEENIMNLVPPIGSPEHQSTDEEDKNRPKEKEQIQMSSS
jgi:hypothetical protein